MAPFNQGPTGDRVGSVGSSSLGTAGVSEVASSGPTKEGRRGRRRPSSKRADTAKKAPIVAELLAPSIFDLRSATPAAPVGWSTENAELAEFVRFQLEAVLQASPALQIAVNRASEARFSNGEGPDVVNALAEALGQQETKLHSLWSVMECAGGVRPDQNGAPGAPGGTSAPGGWRDRSLSAFGGTMLLLISLAAVVAAYFLPNEVEILLLKVFAIVMLAWLPGWLFLRFIVSRAGTIWTEYVLNIHRLGVDEHQNLPEPPATSIYYRLWYEKGGSILAGAPNVYRQKFETYYGKSVASLSSGMERISASDRTLIPVFLTTAVFAAGWATVLWREALFTPRPPLLIDLLRFGFLGAYSFILQMMIRRYFQSDLKASAYLSALVRVATVLILVSVLYWVGLYRVGLSTSWQCGLAFFVGFFPLVGMQLLQKGLTVQLRRALPTLENPYPLSDLVGLNVWYEARLLEEGIEDMQNLVTANLVDVLLHTRVPVGRLVDWIDQAHLYLALEPPRTKKEAKALRKGQKKTRKDVSKGAEPSKIDEYRNSSLTQRQVLRQLGIRTATDFETVFRRPDDLMRRSLSRSVLVVHNKEFVRKLRGVLNRSDAEGPNVAEAILKVLCNSPGLTHVRHWRDMLLSEHHEQVHSPELVGATSGTGQNGHSAVPSDPPAGSNGHTPSE